MTRTVALLSERPGWGRGLVASLPRSLCLARGDNAADVALVDGAPGWMARAMTAMAQGTRDLLVLDPTPADPTALADAADKAGARVAFASALADHPAVAGLRDRLDESFAELVLDGTGDEGLDSLLFGHLQLLHALGVGDLRLEAIAQTPAAYLVEGEGMLAGTWRRLRLTGASGPAAARTTLSAHAPAATARLLWQAGADARPAQVSLADAGGLMVLPAIHEGGHRHALRNILAQGPNASVRDLGDLRTLLDQLIGTP